MISGYNTGGQAIKVSFFFFFFFFSIRLLLPLSNTEMESTVLEHRGDTQEIDHYARFHRVPSPSQVP